MNRTEINKVKSALDAFRAAANELQQDATIAAATDALVQAKATADALAGDDVSKTAEQLVDDRDAARRAVSIAELRLHRAKSAAEDRAFEIASLLNEPAKAVSSALKEAGPIVEAQLLASLKELLQDDFIPLHSTLTNVAYRRGRRLFQSAQTIEAARNADELASAITAALPMVEALAA